MKTRDEILSAPRPARLCCRCGEICVHWTWYGSPSLVQCAECTALIADNDERERARMMGQRAVRVLPKKRVIEEGSLYEV